MHLLERCGPREAEPNSILKGKNIIVVTAIGDGDGVGGGGGVCNRSNGLSAQLWKWSAQIPVFFNAQTDNLCIHTSGTFRLRNKSGWGRNGPPVQQGGLGEQPPPPPHLKSGAVQAASFRRFLSQSAGPKTIAPLPKTAKNAISGTAKKC